MKKSYGATPNQNDVLGGRGNSSNMHPGNIMFRKLVAIDYDKYSLASNAEKKRIAARIIDTIQNKSPPGRFLAQDKDTGSWICMHSTKALQKVCQRLREYQPGRLKDSLTDSYNSEISAMREMFPVSMDISQKNLAIVTKQSADSVDKEIKSVKWDCDTKKVYETFMAKSLDDLDSLIKAEEEKYEEIDKIADEIKILQQRYEEKNSKIDPSDLALMKTAKDRKKENGDINIDAENNAQFPSIKFERAEPIKLGNYGTLECAERNAMVSSMSQFDVKRKAQRRSMENDDSNHSHIFDVEKNMSSLSIEAVEPIKLGNHDTAENIDRNSMLSLMSNFDARRRAQLWYATSDDANYSQVFDTDKNMSSASIESLEPNGFFESKERNAMLCPTSTNFDLSRRAQFQSMENDDINNSQNFDFGKNACSSIESLEPMKTGNIASLKSISAIGLDYFRDTTMLPNFDHSKSSGSIGTIDFECSAGIDDINQFHHS